MPLTLPQRYPRADQKTRAARMSDETEPTWTLILCRGVHTITLTAAQAIIDALQAGDKQLIVIELDPFGSGAQQFSRATWLVLSHVVALTPNPLPRQEPEPNATSITRLAHRARHLT